jgi:hypothetical protein
MRINTGGLEDETPVERLSNFAIAILMLYLAAITGVSRP